MRDPFDLPSVFQQLSEPVKTLARLADFIINSFQPTIPPSQTHPIKIVSISDSHSLIPPTSIPEGDILIHAGDLTNKGTPSELQAQIDWLDSLPHRHKIAISGNHDTYLDPKSRQTLPAIDREGTLNWKSITYLQDTSITLTIPSPNSSDGNPRVLKIHGSPHIPACGGPDFAFQYPRSQGREIWERKIPADVDVLVTHTPPRFHFDLTGGEGLGDSWLLREVRRVRPKIHIFGHVHAGKSDLWGRMRRGREVVRWNFGGMEGWFEKVMERQGEIGAFARVVDVWSWGYLVIMVCCGIWGLVKERISTRKSSSTIMVNASLMYRNTGQLLNPPQEVVI